MMKCNVDVCQFRCGGECTDGYEEDRVLRCHTRIAVDEFKHIEKLVKVYQGLGKSERTQAGLEYFDALVEVFNRVSLQAGGTEVDDVLGEALDAAQETISKQDDGLKEAEVSAKGKVEKDIKFLKEIKSRLVTGELDTTQREFAYNMIDDWIDELEMFVRFED